MKRPGAKDERLAEQASGVSVSVVIPTYNAAAFLADALQTVRDQTFRDFECLVVDDASTDASLSIARDFAGSDARFRSISLPANGGVSAARNRGLDDAHGRWIAVLDADDLFLPTRLEQLIAIGDGEGADIVFDDQLVTDFPRKTSAQHAFAFSRRQFAFTQEDFFAGSRLFRKAFPAGYMKPVMRREFLRRIKAEYDPGVASGEDFLFYAELFAARPKCIGTSFAGYVYRRRRGSLSWSEEHLHLQVALGDKVLKKCGDRLSPMSRAALAGRKGDFDDLASAMPALAALRQRQWIHAAQLLIRRPGIGRTVLRRLRARALRRWSALTR